MIATHRRLASIAATACCAVSAGGALASQASAATLVANQACYVNGGPGNAAAMTDHRRRLGAGQHRPAHRRDHVCQRHRRRRRQRELQHRRPELSGISPGAKTTKLTATADNPDGSTVTGSVSVMSANLAVATSPSSVRNVRKEKVTFSFSGFVPGKHIYGYYLLKKVVAKVKFGKAHGPCGVLKQKALLYPGGRPSKDKYKVTFESSSRYDKTAFPRVTGTLNILHF